MSTQTTNQSSETQNQHTVMLFDGISEPGAYICNWSGHLLRVPQDGVAPGRSPVVNLIGQEPLTVTKISSNPFIPLTKAKLIASNFDLHVNF